ncbi:MAG: hypothetical protein A3G81_30360 [Betaproteobacteria bacterium RIFCSPLOWO2_12_FULL_65_14]|nr:MAG: hypothetical protein A3G81_30360 [Betaproteobacteria bacterium RIFCSPLOWO2_12_FULL_65_14]
MITRRHFVAGTAAILSSAALRPALAQSTLRMLVGFAPGGAVDIVARTFADAMRASLAKTVVVETKTGAGGALAVQTLAGAEPDGNTMLLCPASVLTLRPSVENTLRLGPERQLAPVSQACQFNFALAVGPGTPARTLSEFTAWCKAHPKQASFGSPGTGTGPHIIGALFAQQAGIPLVHVAYRGGAQAMADLFGGQVPAMFTTLPIVIPPHKAQKIRILASTASERIDSIADVPTFTEAGYPELRFEEWFGFFVPPRTPAPTVEALNRAVRAAIADEATRKALAKVEFLPRATSPAELGAMVKADSERWKAIVQRLGIKPQG